MFSSSEPTGTDWSKSIVLMIERCVGNGSANRNFSQGIADVLSLLLDGIDWYRNTLSIIRPKTGVRIEVPLRPQVAHALATYIQTARPANTGKREVFLRHYAPWAKVPTTSTIRMNLKRYAEKAGIPLPSRCKLKVFR